MWGGAACGELLEVDGELPPGVDGGAVDGVAAQSDASADGGEAGEGGEGGTPGKTCAWDAPFESVVPVDVGGLMNTGSPRLTDDELEMVFDVSDPGGNPLEVRLAKRVAGGVFGSNSAVIDFGADASFRRTHPSMTGDGKQLVFESRKIPSGSQADIWMMGRGSRAEPFTDAQIFAAASDPDANDLYPFLTHDGAELWFASDRGSAIGIYRFEVGGVMLGVPTGLADNTAPVLSADRLTIYLNAPAGTVVAHRDAGGVAFGVQQVVGGLDSSMKITPGWLSVDQCRLYITADNGIQMAKRTAPP